MYPYITEALEGIVHKSYLERYSTLSDWDNESKMRASSALAGISNFEFSVIFTTVKITFLFEWSI